MRKKLNWISRKNNFMMLADFINTSFCFSRKKELYPLVSTKGVYHMRFIYITVIGQLDNIVLQLNKLKLLFVQNTLLQFFVHSLESWVSQQLPNRLELGAASYPIRAHFCVLRYFMHCYYSGHFQKETVLEPDYYPKD